jgi:hypothetical protein
MCELQPVCWSVWSGDVAVIALMYVHLHVGLVVIHLCVAAVLYSGLLLA